MIYQTQHGEKNTMAFAVHEAGTNVQMTPRPPPTSLARLRTCLQILPVREEREQARALVSALTLRAYSETCSKRYEISFSSSV